MKTIVNNMYNIENKSQLPYIISKNNLDINHLSYREENKRFLLQIGLSDFPEDHYHIFLDGHYLTLAISDDLRNMKPYLVHNMNQRLIQDKMAFEKIKSVDIWLPDDNYFLINHYYLPEDQILNIYLGKMDFD